MGWRALIVPKRKLEYLFFPKTSFWTMSLTPRALSSSENCSGHYCQKRCGQCEQRPGLAEAGGVFRLKLCSMDRVMIF